MHKHISWSDRCRAREKSVTYLGVDLHCEEETEVGVWSQTVKFLLELNKPLRSQVNVLQHHPAAGLGRQVDSLVRLAEAFRRPCSQTQAGHQQ